MIVRDRPSGFRLFLVLRGSILKTILPVLSVNVLVATAITVLHGQLFQWHVLETAVPFTLLGLPLAIFLGFRNNAAYDRYWEARKQWGELLTRCRTLSRQCQSLIAIRGRPSMRLGLDDIRVRMVQRAIVYAYALKQELRGEAWDPQLERYLRPAELERLRPVSRKSSSLLTTMGLDLKTCLRRGQIEPVLAASVDSTLNAMTAAAAACERIKSTPIPFSYSLLLHRTAYIYCFLLPFGLVSATGVMTPFVVAVIAYTFFGLDALGDEIEEPFGMAPNDLPLDAICRAIEIDLRVSLLDDAPPKPLVPVDFLLS